LIWELGASFGHVGTLLPLARQLRERGHAPALVLRELRNLAQLPDSRAFRLFQAPVWLAQVSGLPEPPLNYSEILLRYGYHDAAALTVQLQAWIELLKTIQPAAVVLEHAPTAALAARLLDIPAMAVGGTFNIPPRQTPLPNMRPWLTVPDIRLSSSDKLVLDNINRAMNNLGGEALDAMSELFDNATCLLCAYPELDHYPSREGGRYIGPLFMSQSGEPVHWPEGSGKKIFAYLPHSIRGFGEILDTLSALPHCAIVVSPGISEKLGKQYSRGNLLLTSRPCQLESIAEACDLAITAGNNGTVNSLLSYGVPQLMFAQHLEHYLFARRIAELGVGEVIDPEQPMPPLLPLINRLLEQESYRDNARAFARRHAGSGVDQRINSVTDTIVAVMKEFR
jgi:UDP:flavonoid glycosyltransferase YjiC (YdhE family)